MQLRMDETRIRDEYKFKGNIYAKSDDLCYVGKQCKLATNPCDVVIRNSLSF